VRQKCYTIPQSIWPTENWRCAFLTGISEQYCFINS
jgi:hypothetical protein